VYCPRSIKKKERKRNPSNLLKVYGISHKSVDSFELSKDKSFRNAKHHWASLCPSSHFAGRFALAFYVLVLMLRHTSWQVRASYKSS